MITIKFTKNQKPYVLTFKDAAHAAYCSDRLSQDHVTFTSEDDTAKGSTGATGSAHATGA